MTGPRRIELNQLGRPAESAPIAELRFTNKDGKTEVWMLGVDTLDFEGLSSPQRVRIAYLDEGIDIRLGNQRDSIDRLLRHVNAHHEDLKGEYETPNEKWQCTWQDPDAPPAA